MPQTGSVTVLVVADGTIGGFSCCVNPDVYRQSLTLSRLATVRIVGSDNGAFPSVSSNWVAAMPHLVMDLQSLLVGQAAEPIGIFQSIDKDFVE